MQGETDADKTNTEDGRECCERRCGVMVSCEDCIQYDVCEYADGQKYETQELLKADCPRFKNNADVVEVVRCKDCTEWDKNECECSHWYGFRENNFCSYGERKDT